MATWEADGLIPSNDDASDDVVWARLRHRRNRLLTDCDWRVVTDAQWQTAAWLKYRQDLRDLPTTIMDPRNAEWPTEPDGQ